MDNIDIFKEDIKNRFSNIGIKLYNFKHSLDLVVNYIEDEADNSLKLICTLLILKKYFSEIKDEYNKLEKDLGVLI